MSFEVLVDRSAQYPAVTLRNTVSGAEAEIYGFGGLLNAFRIPVHGQMVNAIEGFASVADAVINITHGFKSAKLSPYVCRLNEGSYVFENQSFKVNGFYMSGHAIHGLLYNQSFDIVDTSNDDTQAAVTLQYQYEGSDAGYPFPFTMQVQWQLSTDQSSGNRLTVVTRFTNRHHDGVPLSDGWHPYFSLGNSLDECTLQFNSGLQVVFNKDLLPTGDTIPDERFIQGASMNGVELDNCFLLDPAKEPSRCILQNGSLRLSIEPDASYPYLQIYTPPHRKSIAIENLSSAPDAFNNGIGLIVAKSGETRSFATSYVLRADA